jgi:hypothetical protein
LQITEELWEAAYFDQVELLAVDHPATIDIFSNEKVGPAEVAEFRIHTVRERRRPVAARNHRGRDLLPSLLAADNDVAQPFDATFRQGLAEDHYLEFDLGKLDEPRQIALFLTGWIRPTDTSLNVAISHHPELKAPKPPSIWVPSADGQWREAIPYTGFPGGKTKTIAIDLSGIFSPGDYRFRLATSAEIYWDEAFFTVDEQAAEVRVTPLSLASADLHYRGFSAAIPGPRTLPELYDYADVDSSPRWAPMQGRFTRYGDVTELLRQVDSRQVIMASGDEITIRFEAPRTELPAGWTRDFIIHNVGWDKDADLNTVFGQTVEPLPFVGMEKYPYAGEEFPQTELHRRYLREYQTRETPAADFWRALEPPVPALTMPW